MTEPENTTALVIAAHPDDGDFGAAGYVSAPTIESLADVHTEED